MAVLAQAAGEGFVFVNLTASYPQPTLVDVSSKKNYVLCRQMYFQGRYQAPHTETILSKLLYMEILRLKPVKLSILQYDLLE